MKVRDIMSRPVISEDEDALVIKIAKDMADLEVGSLVITSEGKPTGIITERDIALKVLLKNKRASEVKAKEIMSSPLVTIEAEALIEEACELASKKDIKRLPVVENGVLVGVVSVGNILTKKPEFVKRFYPEVRVLASGWTLDRLEKSLSECEVFLAGRDIDSYGERLKEVYEELSKLVSNYLNDEDLIVLFGDMERLFHDIEGKSEQSISIEEQRELLENVLRKFRHVTYWRKQQTPTGFASDGLWFKDHRHGTGKELRLSFK